MKCIVPDNKPSPLAPSPKFNLSSTFFGMGSLPVPTPSFMDEPARPTGPPHAIATELLCAIPGIPFVACRRLPQI